MTIQTLRSFIKISVLLVCVVVLDAQTKPNFSGTWKLNTLESDFGLLPAPASRTDVIQHNDPSLKVVTEQVGAQGTQSDVADYVTDGSDCANRVGSRDVKSKVFWQGNDLLIASIVYLDDSQVNSSSVWTLSNAGRTLTQRNHLQIATRDIEQTLVFDKVDAAGPASKARDSLPVVTAASGANYSGVWTLMIARSDFGAIPAPDLRVDVIDHHEPSIRIDTTEDSRVNGKQEHSAVLRTDGKAAATHFAGLEGKSSASWLGQNLVVNTRAVFQGSQVAIKTTYVLSPDGQTLTQYSVIKSPTGDTDQKLVFEKQ